MGIGSPCQVPPMTHTVLPSAMISIRQGWGCKWNRHSKSPADPFCRPPSKAPSQSPFPAPPVARHPARSSARHQQAPQEMRLMPDTTHSAHCKGEGVESTFKRRRRLQASRRAPAQRNALWTMTKAAMLTPSVR